MSSNIYDTIETCNVYKNEITEKQLELIIRNHDLKDWVRASRFFVKGIGTKHDVPGKVVDTFIGIADHYTANKTITNKQFFYLAYNLISYWPNLTIEARVLVL